MPHDVSEDEDMLHVLPQFEGERPHVASRWCWCEPEPDVQVGDRLWIHRREQ